MTFDLTPDWLHSQAAATEAPMPRSGSAAQRHLLPCPPLAAQPPSHPTLGQMAVLVDELFAEGSLTFEQLCSLSNVPELGSLLGNTIAGADPLRRTGAARR